MKKVLIVGGRGYIGGRLEQYLNRLGEYEIIISTHRVADGSNKNLIQINLDCPEKLLIEKLKSVDIIIYLASLNAQQCANTADAYLVNTVLVSRIVDAARKSGVKKFIYISTAHIYGAALKGVITEETIPAPVSNYAMTHLAAEKHVLSAHISSEMECAILRLSNAFGYPMSQEVNCWSLLMNDLAKNILLKNTCKLRSSGEQMRDFITLSDVVRYIVMFISMPQTDMYPVYNVGSGMSMKIKNMAGILVECAQNIGLSVDLELENISENFGEFRYSIDKLKKVANTPDNDVYKEVYELLNFCKKNYSVVNEFQS
ncbi:MAG: SDR family oxidoreductase [Gammaproteobacteria bacterium]|nr:SDR family oxidoreductase [Gammaproteobacteria bacterium]